MYLVNIHTPRQEHTSGHQYTAQIKGSCRQQHQNAPIIWPDRLYFPPLHSPREKEGEKKIETKMLMFELERLL